MEVLVEQPGEELLQEMALPVGVAPVKFLVERLRRSCPRRWHAYSGGAHGVSGVAAKGGAAPGDGAACGGDAMDSLEVQPVECSPLRRSLTENDSNQPGDLPKRGRVTAYYNGQLTVAAIKHNRSSNGSCTHTC
jgi:hypothetical protein